MYWCFSVLIFEYSNVWMSSSLNVLIFESSHVWMFFNVLSRLNVLMFERSDIWMSWYLNVLEFECSDFWTFSCLNVLSRLNVLKFECSQVWKFWYLSVLSFECSNLGVILTPSQQSSCTLQYLNAVNHTQLFWACLGRGFYPAEWFPLGFFIFNELF